MRDPLLEAHDRPRLIGVGNPWRRDDGAGPAVASRCGGTQTADPSRLLDLWADVQWAIVIDASASGAPPGTVRRFDATADPLPAAAALSSTHAFSVGDAIELARALGRLPARLEVIAVEGEDFTAGPGLTAAVESAVADLIGEFGAGGA